MLYTVSGKGNLTFSAQFFNFLLDFKTESITAGRVLPNAGKHLASDDGLYVNPVGVKAGKFLTEELRAYID